MKYKENWEESKQKLMEYWNMENHDRPLISLQVKNEKMPVREVIAPEDLYRQWTDTEYIINLHRSIFERTLYLGESLPVLSPNLGPDFFGATMGTEIVFQKDTSYSVPIIQDWERADGISFSPENKWWKLMTAMTERFVEDAKGDYIVGITDMHPGVDGVVSLRGATETCYDMADNPEYVVELAKRLFDVYKQQLQALHSITEKNGTGCSNWSGLWHEKLWYMTSCDFICMISQEMFADYIAPLIEQEAKMLGGKTIFHLDGPGALKHLDALLDIPEIAGIQWVYGTGQPTAAAWLDVLKKIQAKNKRIQINVERDDIPVLVENLRPEGLYLNCAFTPDLEEANAILKSMSKS